MSRSRSESTVRRLARGELPRRGAPRRDQAPRSGLGLVTRPLPLAAAALVLALSSGTALARGGGGGGHGGGGHGRGGHAGARGPGGLHAGVGVGVGHCRLSTLVAGDDDSEVGFASRPSLTLYGRSSESVASEDAIRWGSLVDPALLQTLEADELARQATGGPVSLGPPGAAVTPATTPRHPPSPGSPGDIYVQTDAQGVLHFTSYAPGGQSQLYLRGEPATSPR